MSDNSQNRHRIVFNKAGDADGGGSGGTPSILTPPSGGGGAAASGGDPNPAPGAANNDKSAGDTPPSSATPGANNKDWRSELPAELQADASLKKFGSVSTLAQSYLNAQKLIGKDKIPVPGPETSDEQWKEIFEKLGVPSDAKEYKVKFKDGVQLEEKFTEAFRDNAHKLGILPKQAQALADWFSDINLQSNDSYVKEAKASAEKNINALKQEWGAAYAAKVARINKVLDDHGGMELKKEFDRMGLGAEPAVLKLLAQVGDKLYKEDKVVGDEGGVSSSYTPAEARAEALKITSDPKHAYWFKEHPQHKDAVAEVARLWGIAKG